MELPTTFYTVSQVFGNNFFVLEITGKEPLTVIIPDGHYDYLGLQNYINNFLLIQTVDSDYANIQFLTDMNTPGGSGPTGGSGKMIVGSLTGLQQFSINFLTDNYGNEDRQSPLPLKLGWIMGFRQGYYENASKEGQGEYIWPDGNTYIGEWKNNMLNGKGLFVWHDDRMFLGDWKDNVMHGEGTYRWGDGRMFMGSY
jgi:hypothetical protein